MLSLGLIVMTTCLPMQAFAQASAVSPTEPAWGVGLEGALQYLDDGLSALARVIAQLQSWLQWLGWDAGAIQIAFEQLMQEVLRQLKSMLPLMQRDLAPSLMT